MKNKILSYYFGKGFNIFFFIHTNYIILKKKSRFFFLKIPYIYFLKSQSQNEIISFIFPNYFCYVSFLRHIIQLYNKLSSFYYLRLKLKGLGYRIVHISNNLVKIFFNRSNFFYLHLPMSVLFKYKIRRLFFISTKLTDLRNLMITLLLVKKYIVYRLSGLFYPRQIILLKPGKNKFR